MGVSRAKFLVLQLLSCTLFSFAFAEPGFYTLQSEALPHKVRESAAKVLKLWSPLFPAYSLDSANGQRMLEFLTQSLQGANYDDHDRELFLSQIRNCQKTPVQTCAVYDAGSAFLVEEGGEVYLWTSLHSFSSFLAASLSKLNFRQLNQEKWQALRSIRIPIRLENSLGEKLFGGDQDYAQVSYIDSFLANGFDLFDPPASMDYVKLKLSRTISWPVLEFAKDEVQSLPGEIFFLAGYPRLTYDRVQFGGTDSDGKSLRVSIGRVLSAYEAYERLTKDFLQLPLGMRQYTLESLYHDDGDCVFGNSGGAVLNQEGNVRGLHNASAPTERRIYVRNKVCITVRANYLRHHTSIVFQK